jgi:hypothetical protein
MLEITSRAPTMVRLTLLIPRASLASVVDWLLAHQELNLEFSAHHVEARGALVALSESEERVQGYAHRCEVNLIAASDNVMAALDSIEALLGGCGGGYWITTIEKFSMFGRS